MDADDLNKALGAFFMCFGAGLPPELKTRIRDRTHLLADQIEQGGEPNVARLARGLADALTAPYPMPPSH